MLSSGINYNSIRLNAWETSWFKIRTDIQNWCLSSSASDLKREERKASSVNPSLVWYLCKSATKRGTIHTPRDKHTHMRYRHQNHHLNDALETSWGATYNTHNSRYTTQTPLIIVMSGIYSCLSCHPSSSPFIQKWGEETEEFLMDFSHPPIWELRHLNHDWWCTPQQKNNIIHGEMMFNFRLTRG